MPLKKWYNRIIILVWSYENYWDPKEEHLGTIYAKGGISAKFMDSGKYIKAPCWKCDSNLFSELTLKVKEVKALIKHGD